MANIRKVDLGKYDLNKLLRDPSLVHKIQDNLMAIKGDKFVSMSIPEIAKTDIKGCIKMIVDQYRANPSVMFEIVGEETLKMIEQFEGITLADDIKDINI